METFYYEEPNFFDRLIFWFNDFGVISMFGGIFLFIIFGLIFGLILFAIIGGIKQWNKNNKSPRLTVPVEIVSKRTDTSGGSNNSSAHTSYYVTFQVTSGDRMELLVDGREFGLLVEGDIGMLTFQGTRFLTFERKKA